MNQEFSEALNDCLDRLVQGEDTRECLRRYPQQASELEPLLNVALVTMRAAGESRPDPEAKARNFIKFSEAAQARSTRPDLRRSWLSFNWLPLARPIAVGMASILVFVLGAGVATAASSESVPGEPLYWVKTTREMVEQKMPRSDDSRANYEAGLAQARGNELSKLVERGHFTRADVTMKRMNYHLTRSARYAGVTVSVNPVEMPFKPPALIGHTKAERLVQRLIQDREVFRAKVRHILPRLNPQDRRRAVQVFRRTELGYWFLIHAMKTSSPDSRPYLTFQVRHPGPAQ